MTKDEALKLALEALDTCVVTLRGTRFQRKEFDESKVDKAIAAAKEALAQPEQEPVAYIRKDQLQKAMQSAMLCEVTSEPRQDRIGIYTALPAHRQQRYKNRSPVWVQEARAAIAKAENGAA